MAVSVTYYTRGGNVVINGSATAPTATQATQVLTQKAVVVFGVTADTQARFTHNWGLSNSAAAFFDPQIQWYQLSDTTACPSLTFDVSNTNVCTINKAATNAPVTIVVTLRKPGSLGQ